jgi:hypothetical protein
MINKGRILIVMAILLVLLMAVGSPMASACSGPSCHDEGCTPGYWKNHLDSWGPTGYSPDDDFSVVFGAGPSVTLIDALNTGGGWKTNGKPLRHGTAALLNAAHPGVSFGSEGNVIQMVLNYFLGGRRAPIRRLVEFNQRGCPLN